MRGLTIVVTSADAARLDAALTMANAVAALGGRARLYLHDDAVTLPMPAQLAETANELGVRIIACQSALARHGVPLPPGCEGGGMVGVLAHLDDDRLVVA